MKKQIQKEIPYVISMLFLLSIIICIVFRKYIFDGYYFMNKAMMADSLKNGLPSAYVLYDSLFGKSHLWSWNMGIGTSMFTVLGGLFDPFTYVWFIGGRDMIPQVYLWSFIIRLIASAISAYIYLHSFDIDRRAIVLASISYAMCGFSLTMGTNIGYVTVMVYLPLVLLGLEKWIKNNKKFILLFAMLVLTGLYWYYMFYAIGIICAVYVLIRMHDANYSYKDIIIKECQLAVLGIVSFLLSAISILPQVNLVLQSPRISGTHDVLAGMSLLIPHIKSLATGLLRTLNLDILGSVNTNNYVGITCSDAQDYLQMATYVSVFFQLVLIQLLYHNKERRKYYLQIIAISIVAAAIPFFSYLFNYFSTINVRWMFVFSLLQCLGLALGIEQIINNGINIKALIFSIVLIFIEILFGIIILSINNGGIEFIKTWLSGNWKICFIVISLCFMFVVLAIIGKYINKYILYIAVVCLMFIDISANYNRSFAGPLSVSEYSEENESDYMDSSAIVIADIMHQDQDFYRINKDFDSVSSGGVGSNNDAQVQHYYGLKNYNSLNNANYIEFLKSLGIYIAYPTRIEELIDSGTKPEDMIGAHLNFINGVYDRYDVMSLLGVKYYLTKDDTWVAPKGFNLYDEDKNINIYKNDNAYPLCYVNEGILSLKDYYDLSYNDREQALLKYTIVDNDESSALIDFYSDEEKTVSAVEKQSRFSLHRFEQDNIEFEIDVDNDNSYLSFSMPYDNDWHVMVDGKEYDTEKINVSLLGARVNSGHHIVELKYSSKAFNAGAFVSLVTLLITIAFCVVYKMRNSNDRQSEADNN